jgi:hypothetical protein
LGNADATIKATPQRNEANRGFAKRCWQDQGEPQRRYAATLARPHAAPASRCDHTALFDPSCVIEPRP